MRYSRKNVEDAVSHLHSADPVMSSLIHQVGPFTLRRETNRFGMLVRSIISQQISTSAARAIRARIEALVAPEAPTAANLAALSDEQLRGAGLSPQKLSYLRDLCRHVDEGSVELRSIGRRSDEEIIEELTRIRGIGRWTAQMFLIFSLGRLDVLPHDDLGVRSAIRDLYGLESLPGKRECHEIAQPWRPYASVASWYCWRSGDLKKATPADTSKYPA